MTDHPAPPAGRGTHRLAPLCLLAVAGACHAESPPPPLRSPINLPVEDVYDVVIDRFDVLYAATAIGVRRFDLRTRAELPQLQLPGGQPATLDLDPAGCRLAIADRSAMTDGVWVLDDLSRSDPRHLPFPPVQFGYGSFSVIWESPTTLLTTSLYAGSGWGDLRRTDVVSGEVETIGRPTENSMLAMSADRTRWAMVESNISSGPVHLFQAGADDALDSDGTGWFTYEVAIAPHGDVVVVPTYNGAYVYDVVAGQLVERPARIGTYADTSPIGMAFSPHTTASFAAYFGWDAEDRGLFMFSDYAFVNPLRIDSPQFSHTGNHALGQGRTRISASGRTLATTLPDTVLVYDVAEWAADPAAIFADGNECSAWR